MKSIQLIHQEPNQECFEILKSTIIENKVLKRWTIDKDTLIQNLPEHVVNEFLDFLGNCKPVFREIYLGWIKDGTLKILCEEEE